MKRLTGNRQFGRKEYGRDDSRNQTRTPNRFPSRDAPRSDDRGPRFNSPRFGRDRDGSEKTMHRVKCDKCGEMCEVPFRPTGDKPVYCSTCFRKDTKSQPKNESINLDEINEKLDKIMQALNIE